LPTKSRIRQSRLPFAMALGVRVAESRVPRPSICVYSTATLRRPRDRDALTLGSSKPSVKSSQFTRYWIAPARRDRAPPCARPDRLAVERERAARLVTVEYLGDRVRVRDVDANTSVLRSPASCTSGETTACRPSRPTGCRASSPWSKSPRCVARCAGRCRRRARDARRAARGTARAIAVRISYVYATVLNVSPSALPSSRFGRGGHAEHARIAEVLEDVLVAGGARVVRLVDDEDRTQSAGSGAAARRAASGPRRSRPSRRARAAIGLVDLARTPASRSLSCRLLEQLGAVRDHEHAASSSRRRGGRARRSRPSCRCRSAAPAGSTGARCELRSTAAIAASWYGRSRGAFGSPALSGRCSGGSARSVPDRFRAFDSSISPHRTGSCPHPPRAGERGAPSDSLSLVEGCVSEAIGSGVSIPCKGNRANRGNH
jgi:hypothetical protein